MGNDKSEVQELREEMRTGFGEVHECMSAGFAEVYERMSAGFAEVYERMSADFDGRLEQRIAESQEETHRYFDIVTERNHDTICLLIEQMRSDRSSLDGLVHRVERIEEREVSTNHRLTLLERKRR